MALHSRPWLDFSLATMIEVGFRYSGSIKLNPRTVNNGLS